MSKNTYKSQKKRGLFTYLEEEVSPNSTLWQGLPGRYMPRLLFLFVLGIFYVGNTHYHEKMARNIARLERETAELRVDYTTLQAGYMFDSKQSEVAKRVAGMGLIETARPPQKVKSK
ncbi:MAG: FtsL-like putative cell division protein [Bacteroidota bacterium]